MSDVCLLHCNLKPPEDIFAVPQPVMPGYARVEEMMVRHEYLLV